MGMISDYFFGLLSWYSQLLMKTVCSSKSKYYPVRVDPILKLYAINKSKQEFTQVNIMLYSEERLGRFVIGVFIVPNRATLEYN